LAQTARRAGLADEAERQLAICERLEGGITEATELERSLLQVEQGDLAFEDSLWRRVEQNPEEAVLILEALTKGYRKYFLLGRMLKSLNTLLEHQSDHVYALLELGWVHERQFYYRLALKDYRRALQVAPENETVQLTLAQALLRLGEAREALALFQGLNRRPHHKPEVGLGLVQCLRKLGQSEEARHLLDRLVVQHPKEVSILVERGKVALERGHPSEAETWLRQAVAEAPFDYQANYTLLMCLNTRGSPQEKKKYKRQVQRIEKDFQRMQDLTVELQRKPREVVLRCEIGQIFLRNGAELQGLRWLKSALQIDPQCVAAHQMLARYYEEHHQPAEAERHRQKARLAKGSPLRVSPRERNE